MEGLKNRATVKFDAIATLEWLYKFLVPVDCGDRIHTAIEVMEVRKTGNGLRGIVKLGLLVWNRNHALVQEGANALMVNV